MHSNGCSGKVICLRKNYGSKVITIQTNISIQTQTDRLSLSPPSLSGRVARDQTLPVRSSRSHGSGSSVARFTAPVVTTSASQRRDLAESWTAAMRPYLAVGKATCHGVASPCSPSSHSCHTTGGGERTTSRCLRPVEETKPA